MSIIAIAYVDAALYSTLQPLQCGRFTGMDFTGVIKPEPKVIKSGTNTINTSIFPLQSIGGYNLG